MSRAARTALTPSSPTTAAATDTAPSVKALLHASGWPSATPRCYRVHTFMWCTRCPLRSATCLSEQGGDLRPAVQSLGRDHPQDRDHAQASRRSHRLHLGAAHLGLGAHPPSPRPHGRAGGRPVAGWIEGDCLPTALFPASGGALGAVPPAVSRDAGRGASRRPPAVLPRSCAARRQGCMKALSEATAPDRWGGLRKRAVRRTRASVALLVALHPPHRHLQSQAGGRR